MFLDTAGLLALVYRREPRHAEAVAAYEAATNRVTHSYVLAEFIPLAAARGLRRDVALEFAQRMLATPEVEVVWVGEALHAQAIELLHARRDKSYSLCDVVSFVVMRQQSIFDALTTDRHFEQKGFRRLLSREFHSHNDDCGFVIG